MKMIISPEKWDLYRSLRLALLTGRREDRDEIYAITWGKAVVGVVRENFIEHHVVLDREDSLDLVPVNESHEDILGAMCRISPFNEIRITFCSVRGICFRVGEFTLQLLGSTEDPRWSSKEFILPNDRWKGYLVENNITEDQVEKWKERVGKTLPPVSLVGGFFYSKEKGLHFP